MDLRGIILSDISQLEKDKYPVISLIYGIHKKHKVTKNRLVIARDRGWRSGQNG